MMTRVALEAAVAACWIVHLFADWLHTFMDRQQGALSSPLRGGTGAYALSKPFAVEQILLEQTGALRACAAAPWQFIRGKHCCYSCSGAACPLLLTFRPSRGVRMLVQIPGATNLNAVSLQHWLRTNYPRFRYDVRGSNVLALAGNGNAGILMKPVGGTSVKLQWTIPNQGAVIIIVLLTIAALGLGLVMMLGAWLSSRSVTDKLTNELAHVLRTGQPPHGDLAPAYRETTTQDKINLMIITGGGCSLLIGATAFLGGVAEGAFGAIFVGLLFIAGGVALVKLWLKRRAETEGQAAGPSPVAHGAPNAQHQQPQHPQPQYGHAQYQQPQYQQPQYQQPQYQQPQYQQPQPGYPQHQEPQYAQPQSGLAPSSPNGPLPAGPPLSPHGPGAWRVH